MKVIDKTTLIDIEESIHELNTKKSGVVIKKQELEVKLSNLNTAVKARGTRLPDHEYKAICREQSNIKMAKNVLEKEISEINAEIRKKQTLKDRLKLEIPDIDVDIVTRLNVLKSHYVNFAADKSRVSSMRIMASEFVEKLEDIIVDINT